MPSANDHSRQTPPCVHGNNASPRVYKYIRYICFTKVYRDRSLFLGPRLSLSPLWYVFRSMCVCVCVWARARVFVVVIELYASDDDNDDGVIATLRNTARPEIFKLITGCKKEWRRLQRRNSREPTRQCVCVCVFKGRKGRRTNASASVTYIYIFIFNNNASARRGLWILRNEVSPIRLRKAHKRKNNSRVGTYVQYAASGNDENFARRQLTEGGGQIASVVRVFITLNSFSTNISYMFIDNVRDNSAKNSSSTRER